jgi:class 3 adenylate cyclase
MKIRYKILLILLSLGATAVLVSGYVGYRHGEQSLIEAVKRQLISVQRTKARQVESYFNVLTSHVKSLTGDRMVVSAMEEFNSAYSRLDRSPPDLAVHNSVVNYYRQEFLPALQRLMPLRETFEEYLPKTNATYYLQQQYIVKNPLTLGRKKELDVAPGDHTDYGRAHARYHKPLRQIVENFGYYDLFLIDAETSRVVYTVDKEPDFGTNLLTGPYRTSTLAKVVNNARITKDPEAVFLSDFSEYEPSLGAPAQFIAAPIFDGTKRIGVLAFQLSNDELDNVISGHRGWVREGLGRSGDSGIVGDDYLLRSNARGFLDDPEKHLERMRQRGVPEQTIRRIIVYGSTFLRQEVRLPSVTRALAGEEGSMIQRGSAGGRTLVAYGPLNIPGLRWTLASRIDYDEAVEPVRELRNQLMGWSAALLALTILISLLLTQAIVRPVNALAKAAGRLAAGDLTAHVTVKSRDEIGALSAVFNSMVKSIREKTALIEQKNRENESLLLNILPAPIAERLKGGENRIADNFAEVTVLFADIVGFTTLAGQASAGEVVDFLNDLFTRFDQAAQRHGIEKIKTIGDAYMAVAGMSIPGADHARRMMEMALDMIRECHECAKEGGRDINIRVGINSGPVVAGVIGSTKYIYDLWGDTVNVASRMESNGVPGSIQVTRAVYERLHDEYDFEHRGDIEVKGKGKIETWIVRGPVRGASGKSSLAPANDPAETALASRQATS